MNFPTRTKLANWIFCFTFYAVFPFFDGLKVALSGEPAALQVQEYTWKRKGAKELRMIHL